MLTHNISLFQDILITLSPVQSPAIVKLANAFLECPATADSIESVGMIIKSRCTLPQKFAANFVSHCVESCYGVVDLSSQVLSALCFSFYAVTICYFYLAGEAGAMDLFVYSEYSER
jgi:hypothetical protein